MFHSRRSWRSHEREALGREWTEKGHWDHLFFSRYSICHATIYHPGKDCWIDVPKWQWTRATNPPICEPMGNLNHDALYALSNLWPVIWKQREQPFFQASGSIISIYYIVNSRGCSCQVQLFCWLTDVGEPNLAKVPKMSYPGYDVTEANLQAGGVSSLHLMFLKIRSKSQIFQPKGMVQCALEHPQPDCWSFSSVWTPLISPQICRGSLARCNQKVRVVQFPVAW